MAYKVKMADDYGVTFYDCKLTAGSPLTAKREFVFIVILSSDVPPLHADT